MKITRGPEAFRPITLVLETEQEAQVLVDAIFEESQRPIAGSVDGILGANRRAAKIMWEQLIRYTGLP